PVWVGAGDLHLVRRDEAFADAEGARIVALVAATQAPHDIIADALGALERRLEASRIARMDYPPHSSRPRWPSGLRYRAFEPDRAITGETACGAGLRALPAPGHTPGNLVIVHDDEGWLFSGDQLLPDMTPTPSVQANPAAAPGESWRYPSMVAYTASLRAIADTHAERCFPGHGDPFDGVAEAIAANLGAIAARTARVHDALITG